MKTITIVFIICVSLGASPTRACTFDGVFNNPFMESYPDALDVALATHREVSEGTITKPTLREGIPGLQQTSWWLKLLAKDLNTMLMEDTYFYIIDSHLWAKKKMGMLEIHVTKPTKKKKVLILSAAALSSIVTGEIYYKNALELGVAKLK